MSKHTQMTYAELLFFYFAVALVIGTIGLGITCALAPDSVIRFLVQMAGGN